MRPTKTDAALAAAEAEFADDPERAELLRRARVFKASWIELAEGLTRVRKDRAWQNWGFSSLEEYAKKELHLKQETVDKLTGCFMFLERRAPEVLRRDGRDAPIPTYQAVDFLRRAESREDAPRDVVDMVRSRVLDDGAPVATLSKQYNDVLFPIDEGTKRERDAAGLKNVATRLRDLLADTRAVPKRIATETSEALDRLLEALPAERPKVKERAA